MTKLMPSLEQSLDRTEIEALSTTYFQTRSARIEPFMTSPETECTSMEPEKRGGVATRRHPIPEKLIRVPACADRQSDRGRISCQSKKISFLLK
jgi:hypothetical protein